MLKIRRPLGRLIFNMGIAIPGKTVFLIEKAPCPFLFNVFIDELMEYIYKKLPIWYLYWPSLNIAVYADNITLTTSAVTYEYPLPIFVQMTICVWTIQF